MKFNDTLMMLVRKDIDQGNIPFLLGEPGIGKSSWLTNLAENIMRTKCFVMPANQLADKSDVTGCRLVPVGDPANGEYTQVFFPHLVITQAIQYALDNPRQTPILFIDEINRTGSDVTSELLSIPTLRAIGSKQLPNNLRVVAAGNDKGNVTSLDEASVSRFVLYRVEPEAATFINIHPDLNPMIKNVLIAHPETIFCKNTAVVTAKNDDGEEVEMSIDDLMEGGDDMKQLTTPRTIAYLSRWLNTFTKDEIVAMLSDVHIDNGVSVSALQEAIEGHVGQTTFTTYLMDEIRRNINTIQATSTIMIGKPQCYDAIKACTDLTQMQNVIASLSATDKSATVVYALYERVDNSTLLNMLSTCMTTLEQNDFMTLVQMLQSQQIDHDNAQALLSTNSQLSQYLGAVLTMV